MVEDFVEEEMLAQRLGPGLVEDAKSGCSRGERDRVGGLAFFGLVPVLPPWRFARPPAVGAGFGAAPDGPGVGPLDAGFPPEEAALIAASLGSTGFLSSWSSFLGMIGVGGGGRGGPSAWTWGSKTAGLTWWLEYSSEARE